jgi:hypothetical protein
MREFPLAYIETKRAPRSDSALASALVSHWQNRFLHGKALLIAPHSEIIAKLAQKQWISQMQHLQQERSHTHDADKLLAITHSITRMQQMTVAAEAPHEFPAAHFWCIPPEKMAQTELPRTCHTVYIATSLNNDMKQQLYGALLPHSLVVDFSANDLQLEPKHTLDMKVQMAWEELLTFLEKHNINIKTLAQDRHNIDVFDDVLDNLLDKSSAFLRHARQFQEALHLAQPLQITHTTKQEYELANILARRVSMLTPGIIHHSFFQNENETFSLFDATGQKITRETLSATITRHINAGRKNLAQALETAFINNLLVY